MKALSYQPNRIARSLRTRKTHTIGLVITDITNPFFSYVVRGAEDCAASRGFSVVISNTDEDEVKEETCLQMMLEAQHDGVVVASTGTQSSPLITLRDAGIPFVLIDRKVTGVEADVVLSDNEPAAFRATSYLLEHGHRVIGAVLGRRGVTNSVERYLGFRNAFWALGIPAPADSYAVSGDYRVEGGRIACQELLARSPRPTAIFVANNRMTIGALQTLMKSGLSCPEDISVIGFDDFEGLSLFDPPITTVAQQPYKIGYEAVGLVLNRIERKETGCALERRLDCELVIRESVLPMVDRESREIA